MNVQILSAIWCPARTRGPHSFAVLPGLQAFCPRNQIWKPPLLFWREPIFHRRASSAAAIFFQRQRTWKRGRLARVERRASLLRQTRELTLPAVVLAVVGRALRLQSLSHPY